MGLKAILASDSRFEVIGDFKGLSYVHHDLKRIPVDLFIVDPNVNKESGFEVAHHLKRIKESNKVMIITDNREDYHIINCVQQGIDGYMDKNVEPDEILLGVNKVLNGQKFFSAEVSAVLVNSVNRSQSKGVPVLTTKEKEIIRLLMEGYSSKQIAAKLDVSPRTIHSHRANILGKFNLNNTTQLVTRIAEQKIFI